MTTIIPIPSSTQSAKTTVLNRIDNTIRNELTTSPRKQLKAKSAEILQEKEFLENLKIDDDFSTKHSKIYHERAKQVVEKLNKQFISQNKKRLKKLEEASSQESMGF